MAVLCRILDGRHHGMKVGRTHGRFLVKNINIRGVKGDPLVMPLFVSKCLYTNHIGTALACGLYGPTVLPQYAYFPSSTLCTAFGTTTTLIMIVSVLTDFEALLGDHAIN